MVVTTCTKECARCHNHDNTRTAPSAGVGAFGIQGTALAITHDLRVLNASGECGFKAGQIYNVDASRIICHGGGAFGAHCDIAYPEIAHLYWQSALAAMASA